MWNEGRQWYGPPMLVFGVPTMRSQHWNCDLTHLSRILRASSEMTNFMAEARYSQTLPSLACKCWNNWIWSESIRVGIRYPVLCTINYRYYLFDVSKWRMHERGTTDLTSLILTFDSVCDSATISARRSDAAWSPPDVQIAAEKEKREICNSRRRLNISFLSVATEASGTSKLWGGDEGRQSRSQMTEMSDDWSGIRIAAVKHCTRRMKLCIWGGRTSRKSRKAAAAGVGEPKTAVLGWQWHMFRMLYYVVNSGHLARVAVFPKPPLRSCEQTVTRCDWGTRVNSPSNNFVFSEKDVQPRKTNSSRIREHRATLFCISFRYGCFLASPGSMLLWALGRKQWKLSENWFKCIVYFITQTVSVTVFPCTPDTRSSW